MLRFAFIGRLETEKGFHLVLQAWQYIAENHPDIYADISLDVFGVGSLYIPSASVHTGISYHGYRDKSYIANILKTHTDYVLMPSLFLETFGLSALDALSYGVPVVAYAKGGLVPFVLPELVCSEDAGVDGIVSKIRELYILKNTTYDIYIERSLDIASRYTYDIWKNNLCTKIEKYIPTPTDIVNKNIPKGKILLVNDYVQRIGGAEVYVYTLQKALQELGYSVEIYGYSGRIYAGIYGKIQRYVLMLLATYNPYVAYALRQKIQAYTPDLIWCHAVSRYIGYAGLYAVSRSSCTKWVTYHDVGLLAPRPSAVYTEKDIPKGYTQYIKSLHTHNPVHILGAVYKYIYTYTLWSILKGFHLHIVPSVFLVPYIAQQGIDTQSIWVYEHGMSE